MVLKSKKKVKNQKQMEAQLITPVNTLHITSKFLSIQEREK